MNLKESYVYFLPIAEEVAKLHYSVLPKSSREDILSTSQLNVFEFCNLVLPTLDKDLDASSLEEECYKYVYKNVHTFYRAEIKNFFTPSTNRILKGKKGSEIGQLEDTIESKEYSAQERLEEKTAKEQIRRVFALLEKEDVLIFNNVLKDTHLKESEIAYMHNISEKQVEKVVKKVLRLIFEEAGEIEYNKYSKAIAKAKKTRMMDLIKQNMKYLSAKDIKILKARYILKMRRMDIPNEFGYKTCGFISRIEHNLRILAGDGFDAITRARLVHKLSREREEEKFIKFVREDKSCQRFFEAISPKRRSIFERHYYNGEIYSEIAKTYNCTPMSIEVYCHKMLKQLRRYVYSDAKGKQDILCSLKRSVLYYKSERLEHAMKQVIKDFIKTPDYKEVLKAFPKTDEVIIVKYLIQGMPSQKVAEEVNLTKSGVQQRGNLLCEKLKTIVYGTQADKTRTLQMLHKNHWIKHNIKENVQRFMQREDFDSLVILFPEVDQIILRKYLIGGQRAPIVAKEIGLGRSGLANRAVKLLSQIDILNDGSPAEVTACLEEIKHQTLSKAKVVTKQKI